MAQGIPSPGMARVPLGHWLPMLAVFILYAQVYDNGFVWDDHYYLVDLPSLDWNGLLNFLSGHFVLSKNYFRPLVLAELSLESWIFSSSAMAMHLTQLLLHGVNTFLVTRLASHLLVDVKGVPFRHLPLIAGLFYGLHPALIEAVAWISCRFDLLATFFLLLALLADIQVTAPRRRLMIMVGCYFLATLCKEMALSFILLLPVWRLLQGRLPLARADWRAWWSGEVWDKRLLVGVLLATVCYLLLRQVAMGYLLTVEAMQLGHVSNPFWQGILLSFRALGDYIGLVLFPFGRVLPIHYTEMPIPADDGVAWLTVLGVVVGGVVVGVAGVRRIPRLGWWWLAFAVALLPVLYVPALSVSNIYMADRFLVFPLVFAALGVSDLVGLLSRTAMIQSQRMLVPLAGIIGVLWLIFSAISILMLTPLWKTDINLWHWVVHEEPRSIKAASNLMAAYEKEEMLDELEKLALQCLQQFGPDPKFILGLAFIHIKRDEDAEAELRLRQVLALLDSTPNWKRNMATYAVPTPGTNLKYIAETYLLFTLINQEKWGEFKPHMEAALAEEPEDTYIHLAMSAYYQHEGRMEQAVAALERVMRLAEKKGRRVEDQAKAREHGEQARQLLERIRSGEKPVR